MSTSVAMVLLVALSSSIDCAPVPMPEYLDKLKDLRDYADTIRKCIGSSDCRVAYEVNKEPVLAKELKEIENMVEAEDKTTETVAAAEKFVRRMNIQAQELEGEKSTTDAILRLQVKNNLSYGLYNRARAYCQQDRYIEALADLKRVKILRRKAPGVRIDSVLKFELQIYDRIEEAIKDDVRDLFETITDDVNESHDILSKLLEPLTESNWQQELPSVLIVKKILDDAFVHYKTRP